MPSGASRRGKFRRRNHTCPAGQVRNAAAPCANDDGSSIHFGPGDPLLPQICHSIRRLRVRFFGWQGLGNAESHHDSARAIARVDAIRDRQPRNPHSKSLARCSAERPEETRVFACVPCAAEIWRFRQSTQGFWRSRYARTRAHRGG